MIKTAIIGVSGFGQTHYRDLIQYRERNELEIVGATIINPDEEAEKCATLTGLGCRIYGDYKVMLKELAGKIDLCFIPTGIGHHAPMAIEAMKHGASCLIEKPAAPCIQDVRAMQEVESSTGKFVAVGYQSIYQPETQQIKRDIVEGRIGTLRCVKGIGLWPRSSSYYGRNNWAGRIRNESGWILDSPFNNALAHYLNLLCFFTGSDPESSADMEWIQAGLFRCNPEIENADSAVLHIGTSAGPDIYFYTTHCSEENFGPTIEICGEKGTIRWTMKEAVYDYADGSTETLPIDSSMLRKNLMNAILGKVSDPSRFVCDLRIAERQVLAVNGAHESSPVIPVSAESVEYRELDEGGHRFVCKNIDNIFKQLCEQETLNTAVYPWMTPGDRFPLRGYSEFKGGRALENGETTQARQTS